MTELLKARRRGRPVKDPPWLKEVAEKVGRGTPLRQALWSLGNYTFTEPELKNIYRLKKFRQYYETTRIEVYREWGRIPRTRRVTRVEKWLARINATSLENLLPGGGE